MYYPNQAICANFNHNTNLTFKKNKIFLNNLYNKKNLKYKFVQNKPINFGRFNNDNIQNIIS